VNVLVSGEKERIVEERSPQGKSLAIRSSGEKKYHAKEEANTSLQSSKSHNPKKIESVLRKKRQRRNEGGLISSKRLRKIFSHYVFSHRFGKISEKRESQGREGAYARGAIDGEGPHRANFLIAPLKGDKNETLERTKQNLYVQRGSKSPGFAIHTKKRPLKWK